MGLLDDLKNERVRPRVICKVSIVLGQLDNDESVDLEIALKDPVITAAAIERVLSRKGIALPAGTITRHRRKECTCD